MGPRVFAWSLLAPLTCSCLGMLARADSHPAQKESGLTTVQYGDTVVGEPEPRDGGSR
jgi:hypothetical protein